MPNMRTTIVVITGCLLLAACIFSPLSHTVTESSKPVVLKGYVRIAGQMIIVQAVDQNTGSLVPLGSVPASIAGTPYKAPDGTQYTVYPWQFDAHVLAPNFWSPQTVVADVATAQGRAELVASAGGSTLVTFSEEAAKAALAAKQDLVQTGAHFSDGTTTVLFDQTGVGYGPGSGWTSEQGMISDSHVPGYSPVAWSVGYYTVEDGKKIYGLICAPTTGGPYPVVIYNHGGTDAGNGGNLNGKVTAAGWTAQPMGAVDSLGQCVSWAKRGWVFATSTYRGQGVNITSDSALFPAYAKTSQGAVEFCMGEVTDVLALTDLVASHANTITVGSASQHVTLSVNGKVLMYGYSHGGCITHRAVQQGAPVTAFSVIEGFSDLRLGYLTARSLGADPVGAAIASGAYQPGVSTYQPDASGVMGYNWRSAHYFATRGDYSTTKFKTMPILILHGDIDAGPNPTPFNQAATIARDLNTTNIFVGPTAVAPPSSYACVSGPAGAPLPGGLAAPDATCPITFVRMNTDDPCTGVGAPPPFLGLCNVLMLPLTPPPKKKQQLHYFVVFHNMNHVNGGYGIKYTFNRFAEQNFSRQPGCDGLQFDCATN